MSNFKKLLGCAVALLLSSSIYAGDIQIENAWARATAPGQDSAMVDLTITSKRAATLVSISSTASKTVELHSMTHENGMMKMREVKTMALPAGKPINLGERGYHLMLIGLNAPLKAGENVLLTLGIQVDGQAMLKVETKAVVQPPTAAMPQGNGHMQHRH
jgi:hypothetical protein